MHGSSYVFKIKAVAFHVHTDIWDAMEVVLFKENQMYKRGREVSYSTSIGIANTNIEIQTQIGRLSIPFNVNNIF